MTFSIYKWQIVNKKGYRHICTPNHMYHKLASQGLVIMDPSCIVGFLYDKNIRYKIKKR